MVKNKSELKEGDIIYVLFADLENVDDAIFYFKDQYNFIKLVVVKLYPYEIHSSLITTKPPKGAYLCHVDLSTDTVLFKQDYLNYTIEQRIENKSW